MASIIQEGSNGMQRSHVTYANQLFESGLFSDCSVRSGHRLWLLHRAILAQRCEFFRACFSNQFRESTITSVGAKAEVVLYDDESEAVERMLRWLYTLQYPTLEVASAPVEENKESCFPSFLDMTSCFWTSELALFVVADKYGLSDLAEQASSSMNDAVVAFRWNTDLKLDNEAQQASFLNFTEMLELLYTSLSSASNTVVRLRQALLQRSAMIIAAQITQQPRLSDLVADLPELATDLVEALRQTVEACSGTDLSSKTGDLSAMKPKEDRSLSAASSWAGYRSGSESDAGGQSPRSTSSRQSVHIPMNEDSDLED